MKHEGYLIANAGLQPRLYRTAWGVVTLAFWVAYIYLWLPAATFVMWLAGVRLAAVELYIHQQQFDMFLLGALPVLAVAAAVLLIGWAELNRVWFVGKERRRDVPDVTVDEVATALRAPPPVVYTMQGLKIAVLRMDTDAVPYAVTDGAERLLAEAQTAPTPQVAMPAPALEA